MARYEREAREADPWTRGDPIPYPEDLEPSRVVDRPTESDQISDLSEEHWVDKMKEMIRDLTDPTERERLGTSMGVPA